MRFAQEFLILVFVLIMFLCMVGLCNAQLASIEGPNTAEVGDLIILDASKSQYKGKVIWDIDECSSASSQNVQTFICGEKLIASIKKPGNYSFELIVADGDNGVDKTSHMVKVSQEAPQPSDPAPPEPIDTKPPPTPQPTFDTSAIRMAASKTPVDYATARALLKAYMDAIESDYDELDAITEYAGRVRRLILATRPAPRNPGWEAWKNEINAEFEKISDKVDTVKEFKRVLVAIASGLEDSINASKSTRSRSHGFGQSQIIYPSRIYSPVVPARVYSFPRLTTCIS